MGFNGSSCACVNAVSTAVTYDKSMKAIRVKVPTSDEEFYLHPATVRRNDRSAESVVWQKFILNL